MRCSLLAGLCLFCLLLTVSVVIVLLSQASTCPLGTFRCLHNNSNSGGFLGDVCLPRRLLCDGRPDCLDGSDEDPFKCHDVYGELESLVEEADNRTFVAPTNSCAIAMGSYPAGCVCVNLTWLKCSQMRLKAVPRIGTTLHRMILTNNSIRHLRAADLQSHDLELIYLDHNQLTVIDDDALRRQTKLKILVLDDNRLMNLAPGVFSGLKRLKRLFLSRNLLEGLEMDVFSDLTSLRWLDLSHNHLNIRSGNIFPPSESLRDLFLNENRIEWLFNDTVASLPNLILLDLRHNAIHHVDKDALSCLTRLKFLDLSYNQIEYIPDGLFRSQNNLTKLSLGFNPIVYLSPDLFLPLTNLRSIGLQGIEIQDINVDMLARSTKLDFAYFKNFRYCFYVTHAAKCQPIDDGVSSFTDLISHRVHRVFLWIIGILTIVGNALVLGGRGLAKTENRILAMFVKNLAAADMCIGIYLLCIGERDINFRGQYKQHAHQWMTSWECTGIRILAVSTSEVSLLLLTFMSVERFVSISHPFGERTLNFRTAFISTAVIWSVGMALALVPVLYWSEMGRHHGSNGLCFPLHINEPSALGWQYSAFLYIGINGSCVLVIIGVYTALFLSIRRTRSSTPLAPNEIEIAIRFFFIVFTDCLCWMPTILLKIMALADVYVSADLYAWLVVFVLPVNSAINPFLYTFTTPTFRAAVRDFYRRVTVDWTSAATNSIALTSRSAVARSSISFRHQDYGHCESQSQANHALPSGGEDSDRSNRVDMVLLNSGTESIPFQPSAKWRGSGVKPVTQSFITGQL